MFKIADSEVFARQSLPFLGSLITMSGEPLGQSLHFLWLLTL